MFKEIYKVYVPSESEFDCVINKLPEFETVDDLVYELMEMLLSPTSLAVEKLEVEKTVESYEYYGIELEELESDVNYYVTVVYVPGVNEFDPYELSVTTSAEFTVDEFWDLVEYIESYEEFVLEIVEVDCEEWVKRFPNNVTEFVPVS